MFGTNDKTARIQHPRLPWLIGGLAFLVYVLTLNRTVSLASLPLAAQVAGWTDNPPTALPLLWLLTAPLKLLPDGWIPAAVNLQSALFATLTLVLLARCVQLLPLNRLRLQTMFLRSSSGLFERRDAWLPVAVAGLICGLEPGFWQEAVSATGEMLDALLLAAAVWCVLEYRLAGETRWLDRLALIWGAGMAENWVMIAALPLLVATLIWLWGFGFLQWSRWLRVGWRLLSGLAFFLVLPMVNSLLPHAPWTCKHALKESVLAQTANLSAGWNFAVYGPELAIVMGLFLVLPVLPPIFRLKDEGSYHSSRQARIQIVTLQLLYGAFLVMDLWLALHPVTGPQNLMALHSWLHTPLLTLVFLNALGAGYLTAHFLVICGAKVASIRKHNPQFRLPPFLPEWLRLAGRPLLYALPVILLAALTARSLGPIRKLNHSPLAGFAQAAVASLPAGGGLVISDDPLRLEMVRIALAARPDHRQWVPVDTTRLADPHYRATLERKWPLGWTKYGPDQPLAPAGTTKLIFGLAATNQVYYLHPSFGYFFEAMNQEPHGLVGKITRLQERDALPPTLTPELIQENEQLWDRLATNQLAAIPPANTAVPDLRGSLRHRFFQLTKPESLADRVAASWYSMALDSWGVDLQRAGRWTAARHRFEEALALNTNNVAAQINLAYNRDPKHGGLGDPLLAAGLLQELSERRTRTQNLLKSDGPFDTSVMDFCVAILFQEVGLPRQAIGLMSRAAELSPGEPAPRLTLAEFYLRDRLTDRAWQILHTVRQQAGTTPLSEENQIRLQLLEASAWLTTTNQAAGDRALRSLVMNQPEDPLVLNAVLGMYEQAGALTNALVLLQDRLAQSPQDIHLLTREAGLLQKTGQYDRALLTLDHLLSLTNLYSLQLDRAADRMLTGDLPGAEADYRRLLDVPGEPWRACYGLAQVALRRNDSTGARQWLETAYAKVPADSSQRALIARQIQTLATPAPATGGR